MKITTAQRHKIETARQRAAIEVADSINGTWMQAPNGDKPGFGKRHARVGRQIVNGLAQFPVHVTCTDQAFEPYTISTQAEAVA